MKSIALTGSIGSGKTLVCSVFEHLNIPIFIADIQAKECYKDIIFLKEIAKEFGDNIIKNNVLDKKELANIVFSDKNKLEKLNSMIHPKVLNKFLQWRELQSAPYVILESAIIFEIQWEKYFDKIICINTPKDIAIKRVIERDNISKQEVEIRMNNQLPIVEKCKRSDFVIFHDNKTMILPQILEIHKQL